jgi:8-oxo-dGTP pyrophosphatase MutT (NUDIX family)
METKQAAILLVPVYEDSPDHAFGPLRYWAVSRRDGDISQVGFVGGEVDPGENAFQAAAREAEEEIGLKIKPEDYPHVLPIYAGWNSGNWVTTYLYPHSVKRADLVMEAGLLPRAVSPFEMRDGSTSPFWIYNRGLFDALRRFTVG